MIHSYFRDSLTNKGRDYLSAVTNPLISVEHMMNAMTYRYPQDVTAKIYIFNGTLLSRVFSDRAAMRRKN